MDLIFKYFAMHFYYTLAEVPTIARDKIIEIIYNLVSK